ncbi:MAG: HAD family hydrolase, partial [Chloroflexota bacterium]
MTDRAVPIRALIFDMDGLLVDTEDLAAGALRQFLANHGREMTEGTMERTLGRRLPEAIAIIKDHYGLSGEVVDLTRQYDLLRLEALRGNVVPMRGAADIIRWAREAGLRLALASSSNRTHVDLSLEEAGLAGAFDAEACGDEVTNGKPAPDIFLLAASRISEQPAACVVLEDAPAGLAAAHAAGMRSIWVPNEKTRGLTPETPYTLRASHLDEAREWLARESLRPAGGGRPVSGAASGRTRCRAPPPRRQAAGSTGETRAGSSTRRSA